MSVSFYSIMLNALEIDHSKNTNLTKICKKKFGMTKQDDPALT